MNKSNAAPRVLPGHSLADASPHIRNAEAFVTKILKAAVIARKEGDGIATVSLRLGSRLALPGYLIEWCLGDEHGRSCFPHTGFNGRHQPLTEAEAGDETLWGYPSMDVEEIQILLLSLRPTSKIKPPSVSSESA
jgi:hypothetical protein